MQERPPLITVGDLKRYLQHFEDRLLIDFSGLDFYRLKERGNDILQVEFNQQVYRLPDGRVVVENLE